MEINRVGPKTNKRMLININDNGNNIVSHTKLIIMSKVFTNYNFLRNDYPMVHYLFFFTPKEPKMVLLVSSEILLLHFSTAVRYESANFFKLIPKGLSSDTKFSFKFLSIVMHPEICPRGA